MDNDKINIARHSCAHAVAAAAEELYPGAKFGVGPVVENGFYYDIDFPEPIGEEDLIKIEDKARELIQKGVGFERLKMDIDEAIKFFKKNNQPYKVELLKDIKEKGTTRVNGKEAEKRTGLVDKVSLYKTGEFMDLCRGPHVASAKELNVDGIKLHKLAGAYWRGSEQNPQLQRIYGLYFATKKELDDYLALLEEAKRRDHRKIGKDLNLFTFSDLVGKGLPLWTPYGTTIRRELENFVIEEELKRGYKHVVTPELAKVDLYRQSGHYPYYKDTMYPPMLIDEEELILRPMTCPHHFMLYLDKKRSYRELPMRIAELSRLYRYEKSGELTGMVRVRSFCLADAHIVCAKEQAKSELHGVLDLIEYMSAVLGMEKGKDFSYRLSLGDTANAEKYYKNDAGWKCAEKALRGVLVERKSPFVEAKGEAAFYGPKIDIQIKNILGKEDTAFTVQYDFCMPDRFELAYVDEYGQEKRPIVIHRSSLGAIERTFGFLLEHHAGALPVWLSPVQALLAPVSAKHLEGALGLTAELRSAGIRVEVDDDNETVGNKVRKAVTRKIPYIVVVGDKELSGEDWMIRVRGQKDQIKMKKEDFTKKVVEEIRERR